jgi:hypothetical protein
MNEATRCKEGMEMSQPGSEPEPEHENDAAMALVSDNAEQMLPAVEDICQLEENAGSVYSNLFNDLDENLRPKPNGNPPTIEQIQVNVDSLNNHLYQIHY